jgi:hypothetical protein
MDARHIEEISVDPASAAPKIVDYSIALCAGIFGKFAIASVACAEMETANRRLPWQRLSQL